MKFGGFQKVDTNPGWLRQNEYNTHFTICTTGADDS